MTDLADLLELSNSEGLQNELSQLAARSTLSELNADGDPNWRYRTQRVIRNLTAIQTGLSASVGEGSQLPPDFLAAARTAARGWESLAGLADHMERSTALLNAALGYELAGYQANASCLARQVTNQPEWSSEPSLDDAVASFLQRLFIRVRSLREPLSVSPDEIAEVEPSELTRRAAQAVLAIALSDAATFFLTGDEEKLTSADEALTHATRGFAEVGDAVKFNTAIGIQQLLPVMAHRSTWRQLAEINSSPRWGRYLLVLARGLGRRVEKARSISELWPSQLAAIDGGLLSSSASLAIRMPTGAGKTRVAELAMVHTLVTKPGAKCLYVAPFRALITEIEDSFGNLFQDLGYAASTVPGAYDQDEFGQLISTTDDVLVLTPEKLDLLFRLQPEQLDAVELVVIDEGHIVSDAHRGPKFELLISRLRKRLPSARFLIMSAVVPDITLEHFSQWIGGGASEPVTTDWRPSVLQHGKLEWNGSQGTLRFGADDAASEPLLFVPGIIHQRTYEHRNTETGRIRRPRFPDTTSKSEIAAELAYTYAPQGPVLIFAMQTDWAQSVAEALGRRVELAELVSEEPPAVFRRRNPTRAEIVASEWLGADHQVTRLLQRGIAFHHGRLPGAVREAIERDFRSRSLSVLVATSTLAQGVNLPVRTVVIHSCRSRDQDGVHRVLPARDYWNIAGRAGRAGEETTGTCIHVVRTALDDEDFGRYSRRRSDVEPVESALHRLLRDLIEDRITTEEASRRLDSDLLALLVEEDQTILDTQLLAETLDSTLFSIQAIAADTDIEPLVDVMTTTARGIVERVPDADRRRLYASTGLSSVSCASLSQHATDNAALVRRLLAQTPELELEELTDVLVAAVGGLTEMEPDASLTCDERLLMASWLDGEPVAAISQTLSGDPQQVTRYIEEVFANLLPWGVSAYLRVSQFELELEPLSPAAVNIAGMIKYGVPTPEAVWAMTAGVGSRTAAISIASHYTKQMARASAAGDFRNWLTHLNPDSLNEDFGLTGVDLESTAKAVLRSQDNQYLAKLDTTGDILPLDTSCAPNRRSTERGTLFEVEIAQSVSLRRDLDSVLNRNAIQVVINGAVFGYLPSASAQALGPEIDSGRAVVAEVFGFVGDDEPTALWIRVTEAP